MSRRVGGRYHIATCEWCGQPFYTIRSDARFDSVRCRVANWRFMQHARAPKWERVEEKPHQIKMSFMGKEI
jgi:hypothetical protein